MTLLERVPDVMAAVLGAEIARDIEGAERVVDPTERRFLQGENAPAVPLDR